MLADNTLEAPKSGTGTLSLSQNPVAFLGIAMQHDPVNARAGLAMGFRMVKMSALSCGARVANSARRSL